MIDTSDFRFAKPRARVLEKREAKAALDAEDARQRKLCHKRSGMRCEVIEVNLKPEDSAIVCLRCKGHVSHNHHLIGGRGKRNVGDSILAKHRLDTCTRCHQDIHAGILSPVPCPVDGPPLYRDAATVKYWRLK